jgi:hypothetical protein
MTASQVRPIFARHETFQPRFGWFKKGFDGAASSKGAIFNDDAATVGLGVGKNMVRAIRFWGVASKVLRTERDPRRPRTGLSVPSAFGKALLAPEGWDPYLEEAGSIWLLHWALLRPPCLLPVWWVAFNEFDAIEFVHEDLVDATVRRIAQVAEWPPAFVPSVKKDVDCLVRMYSHSFATRSVEDTNDCPFRSLRLVESLKGTYRFMHGHKRDLPAEIIAFAALDYMDQAVSASTITLSALASFPSGPGRAFKISDDEIAMALEIVCAGSKTMSIESPAGARQLVVREAPGKLANSMLHRYYGRRHDAVQTNNKKGTSLFADALVDLVDA